MEALENFFKSEACFPVIMVLMLLLLGIVVWTTISNKKAQEQMRAKQRQNIDESAEIKIVANEPTVEEVKQEIIPEDLPLVDIPINNMDETEVVIEPVKQVNEVMEEQIVIPLIPAFQEGPVPETEKVNLDFSKPIDASLDVGEKVEIPVPGPLVEEKEEQAITIEEIEKTNVEHIQEEKEEEVVIETVETKEEETTSINTSDVPPVVENIVKTEVPTPVEDAIVSKPVAISNVEDNQAFGVKPTEDTTINENVVVEEPKEYDGNKTEIFDFPDFSEISGEKEITNTIGADEETLKNAHQYINSVMSK